MDHKISPEQLREIVTRPTISKIPGLVIFYSELVHGIPPIFDHYASNIPTLHSVLVFVSVKSLPINKVPAKERFLFRRVQPKELSVFRCVVQCVVQYGYTDLRSEQEPFEWVLVERLKEFVREESFVGVQQEEVREIDEGGEEVARRADEAEERREREVEAKMETLERASKDGVMHLMGESEVVVGKGSSLGKRIMIDYGYNFLKRNLRQGDKLLDVPRKRLLKVGITYEL